VTLQPPLKWVGGKRWQVPHLRPLWQRTDRHRRLVEPFCGGLAVAIGLQPERALLNDANPHLINFYRCLQRGWTPTIELTQSAGVYYAHRARFNELVHRGYPEADTEAANLFFYLNRTGYSGLCRFNRRGEFNVALGKDTRPYQPDCSVYQEAFSRWMFTAGDFERLQLDPTDFIYADPPYDEGFPNYAQGGFTWEDQERTAIWAAQHPGPVVLVNYPTPRIVRLYEALGYQLFSLNAPRSIACNRTPARELIALRNIYTPVFHVEQSTYQPSLPYPTTEAGTRNYLPTHRPPYTYRGRHSRPLFVADGAHTFAPPSTN
jgi:DNA adenine methylase